MKYSSTKTNFYHIAEWNNVVCTLRTINFVNCVIYIYDSCFEVKWNICRMRGWVELRVRCSFQSARIYRKLREFTEGAGYTLRAPALHWRRLFSGHAREVCCFNLTFHIEKQRGYTAKCKVKMIKLLLDRTT